MIKGSIVALVSPMFEDGTIDYDSYRNLIEMHIAAGTNAIVAVGTTGESPTVDYDEHNELVRVAVETAAGRIPVIAGTGSNSTKEAIDAILDGMSWLDLNADEEIVFQSDPGIAAHRQSGGNKRKLCFPGCRTGPNEFANLFTGCLDQISQILNRRRNSAQNPHDKL